MEAAIRRTIGGALIDLGDLEPALSHLEKAVSLSQIHLPADHSEIVDATQDLAEGYRRAGKWDSAVRLFEQVLAKRMVDDGPTNPKTLGCMHLLAMAYENGDRLKDSLDLHEKVLTLFRDSRGSNDPSTNDCMITYARACWKVGKLDDAERLLREALKFRRKEKGPLQEFMTADCLRHLALTLLMQQRYDEAEPLARESQKIYETLDPENWHHFHAMSLVGGALLGQQKYADAKPVLLGAYEGMKQREARIYRPQLGRLTEAVERIVRFYEVTGEPEKARVWREKLHLEPRIERWP